LVWKRGRGLCVESEGHVRGSLRRRRLEEMESSSDSSWLCLPLMNTTGARTKKHGSFGYLRLLVTVLLELVYEINYLSRY
jgi:hypothetical protein